ncbi:MAG: hypothetical protein WBA68_11755 [Alteraurantiacibacter sp.]
MNILLQLDSGQKLRLQAIFSLYRDPNANSVWPKSVHLPSQVDENVHLMTRCRVIQINALPALGQAE